jgi:hypothetical protein
MLGMLAANIANLIMWLMDNLVPQRNQRFMFNFAKMMHLDDSKYDMTLFRIFAFTYLKRDGVFILRMVQKNTSTLLTLELVKELWKTFLQELQKRDRHSPNGAPPGIRRQPSAPAEEEDFDEWDGVDEAVPATPAEKLPLKSDT